MMASLLEPNNIGLWTRAEPGFVGKWIGIQIETQMLPSGGLSV